MAAKASKARQSSYRPIRSGPNRPPLDGIGRTLFIVGPDVRRRDESAAYVQLDRRSGDHRQRLARVAETLAEQLGGRWTVETHGQKGFNGVAILSRLPLEDVTRGLPGDDGDEHERLTLHL